LDEAIGGSWFPLRLLAQTAQAGEELIYLDNGSRELVRSGHDNSLVVRWVLRKHGLTLAGAPAGELIPAMTAAALQREVRATMREWAAKIFDGTLSPGQSLSAAVRHPELLPDAAHPGDGSNRIQAVGRALGGHFDKACAELVEALSARALTGIDCPHLG
jgi:hypothetical protein